jgi:diaminopimelate decarboxylase
MDHFCYRNGVLHCENVPLPDVADEFGTPLYVYSARTLIDRYRHFVEAFAELRPIICYSVKSCQNLHVCRLLREHGASFDVVSGGESEAELENLIRLAGQAKHTVRAALRVNPDVDPQTHVYTTTGKKETKFGVDLDRARAVFDAFGRDQWVRLSALHIHLGSPVNTVDPYEQAIAKVLGVIDELRSAGYQIDTLDIGGGFGADYTGGEAPSAAEYAARIVPLLRGTGLTVILEPGRAISANAGILVGRVLYTKHSGQARHVIVDASMTDLIRPALYGAYHFVWPVTVSPDLVPPHRGADLNLPGTEVVNVVGPVCESGDFLAKQRSLPPLQRGELVAIFSAGAYGFVMSNQYNSRPRAAEVLIEGDSVRLIRRRETYDDLVEPERI